MAGKGMPPVVPAPVKSMTPPVQGGKGALPQPPMSHTRPVAPGQPLFRVLPSAVRQVPHHPSQLPPTQKMPMAQLMAGKGGAQAAAGKGGAQAAAGKGGGHLRAAAMPAQMPVQAGGKGKGAPWFRRPAVVGGTLRVDGGGDDDDDDSGPPEPQSDSDGPMTPDVSPDMPATQFDLGRAHRPAAPGTDEESEGPASPSAPPMDYDDDSGPGSDFGDDAFMAAPYSPTAGKGGAPPLPQFPKGGMPVKSGAPPPLPGYLQKGPAPPPAGPPPGPPPPLAEPRPPPGAPPPLPPQGPASSSLKGARPPPGRPPPPMPVKSGFRPSAEGAGFDRSGARSRSRERRDRGRSPPAPRGRSRSRSRSRGGRHDRRSRERHLPIHERGRGWGRDADRERGPRDPRDREWREREDRERGERLRRERERQERERDDKARQRQQDDQRRRERAAEDDQRRAAEDEQRRHALQAQAQAQVAARERELKLELELEKEKEKAKEKERTSSIFAATLDLFKRLEQPESPPPAAAPTEKATDPFEGMGESPPPAPGETREQLRELGVSVLPSFGDDVKIQDAVKKKRDLEERLAKVEAFMQGGGDSQGALLSQKETEWVRSFMERGGVDDGPSQQRVAQQQLVVAGDDGSALRIQMQMQRIQELETQLEKEQVRTDQQKEDDEARLEAFRKITDEDYERQKALREAERQRAAADAEQNRLLIKEAREALADMQQKQRELEEAARVEREREAKAAREEIGKSHGGQQQLFLEMQRIKQFAAATKQKLQAGAVQATGAPGGAPVASQRRRQKAGFAFPRADFLSHVRDAAKGGNEKARQFRRHLARYTRPHPADIARTEVQKVMLYVQAHQADLFWLRMGWERHLRDLSAGGDPVQLKKVWYIYDAMLRDDCFGRAEARALLTVNLPKLCAQMMPLQKPGSTIYAKFQKLLLGWQAVLGPRWDEVADRVRGHFGDAALPERGVPFGQSPRRRRRRHEKEKGKGRRKTEAPLPVDERAAAVALPLSAAPASAAVASAVPAAVTSAVPAAGGSAAVAPGTSALVAVDVDTAAGGENLNLVSDVKAEGTDGEPKMETMES